MEIKIFSRKNNSVEIEKVVAEEKLKWAYETAKGRAWLPLLTTKIASKLVGLKMSTSASKKNIAPFIEQNQIDMSDFEDKDYRSFNDFFIRNFRPGARRFTVAKNLLPSPVEARIFAYDNAADMEFPVKGENFNIEKLLGKKWAATFKDGPVMICRLAPVDYHHFHFFDDGQVIDHYRQSGRLHSVNPVALKAFPKTLSSNERQVTVLETSNFGKVAMVEVGALCVGAIKQTYENREFKRGQVKGHFLFGGSTVILVGERGAWNATSDLRDNTRRGLETLVRLGDWIATSNK